MQRRTDKGAKPYHADGFATLYLADARDMWFIPDESVDCIVTSPPYWSARKYPTGATTIYGGNPDCEHVWGASPISSEAYTGATRWQHVGGREGMPENGFQKQLGRGQICQLCGAWRGQLGLEPTIELYRQHLLHIFDGECRRVLKPTGTMWVNISDSYAGSGGAGGDYNTGGLKEGQPRYPGTNRSKELKPLDRCGVPWDFAKDMQKAGWYLRREVVWWKPNPMPESPNGWRWERHRVTQCPNCDALASFRKRVCKECGWKRSTMGMAVHDGNAPSGWDVQHESDSLRGRYDAAATKEAKVELVDCPGCPKCLPNDGLVLLKWNWRPTTTHEWIFMFTKTNSYYGDRDAVAQVFADERLGNPQGGGQYAQELAVMMGEPNRQSGLQKGSWNKDGKTTGRNLRSVWRFPTQSYKDAHYATFPLELPTRCIKASTSERGNCPQCGMPWARVVSRQQTGDMRWAPSGGLHRADAPGSVVSASSVFRTGSWNTSTTLKWWPSCDCDAGEPVPAVVLDPFVGSGTTCEAATRLGRASIGIDCCEEYLEMAVKRLGEGYTAYQETLRSRGQRHEVEIEGDGDVRVEQTAMWEE